MLQLHDLEKFRLHTYKNAKLYKEKTRKWHDRYIAPHSFDPKLRVLMLNSSLTLFPGNPKSKWYVPFKVVRMTVHGAVENLIKKKV